jgi:DNA modification methylase/ParB-like chromosome segregation protein Spo0J
MINSLHYDLISVSPDRQRQEFDPEAITDLANSIATVGLLHPPVMRDGPTGPILVAGERRMRAMGQLWMLDQPVRHNGAVYPPYHVPYVTLGDLSPMDAEEAELDENLKRKDLSWQEQAAAIARLHSLRLRQAEALGQTHSIKATMEELPESGAKGLQISQSEDIRKAIILAKHLENPEVMKAKSIKEAFKTLKRQEDQKTNIALAEKVGKNFNSSIHSLIHTDCLEWLATCPDHTFDVICTDPPYGMEAQNFGDGAGLLQNAEHHYDDSKDSWITMVETLCPLLFRVTKPQAHAYIFCDLDRFHFLKLQMEKAGWYVFRTPLVNYKPRSGRIPLPEHGPKRQYELILYAIKGKKTVTAIYSDVISTVLEENLTHGAQKPIELYVDLLRRSIKPGDAVLDAFAGTGTIFPAAHQLKCRATGLEQSSEYFGIAVQRLNALDDQPEFL